MTKLRYFSLTVLMFFVASFCMGQFSKQQADDLVLNQILVNELEKVNVYSLPMTQTTQDGLTLYDNSIVLVPYSNAWVFFVDDLPLANWNHPCRYIFVNSANGSYLTTTSRKYPFNWHSSFTALSTVTLSNVTSLLPNTNASINSLPPNPHMYAVIINGTDGERYWNDCSAIYNTLNQVYGFTKENIFVHYDEGTSFKGSDLDDPSNPSDDIDYNAHKLTIQKTFQELAGETNTVPEIPELGPEDQLFVYVTDHGDVYGNNSYILLCPNTLWDELYDYELANYVKGIKCAQMIYVMEQCFSGGFVDDIMDFTTYNVKCKNRSIHTAANATGYSFAEVHISGLKYDEFVFYWTAAARGWYPPVTNQIQPWLTSYPVGSFPFQNYPSLIGHPGDYNPDLNGDGFVQMEEAFRYADYMDTWSPYGYYLPADGNGDEPDPPLGSTEYPMNYNNTGFTTDLLTMAGYAGRINTNQTTEPRHYVMGGNITVNSPGNLTLSTSTNMNLGNGNNILLIQPNTCLSIHDNVEIFGGGSIQINGNINVGQNVIFGSATSSFGGLYLNNNTLQSNFTNTSFIKSDFHNFGASLTMSNCTFADCHWVYSHRGNVDVNNSNLTETWLYLENQTNDPNLIATVSGCTISNTSMHVGVDLWNYGKYFIENNNIKALHNGIQIYNSGNGSTGNQSIFGNNIHDCNWAGIIAYNVTGSIAGNNIHDNQIGLRLMNNCNVALFGNASAQNYSQTQQIRDNTSYEVYASKYSFPWYFRYNTIIDEDNLGNPYDPLIFYDNTSIPSYYKIDVQYNCWGNNFDPAQDLKTFNGAIWKWSPTWCPGGGGIIPDPIEDMYISAVDHFENENYSQAKNLYQLLIQQYPKSNYAQAAMKELLRLEEYLASDYSGLKEYYLTNDSIFYDTTLVKLGDYLANQCDVKIENWPQAISWFENKVINPSCLEDSVFAIIDLGYVYFLMENQGLKSSYTGNLKQFKPDTKEKYFEHRDYLLSLLPGEMMSEKFRNNLTDLSYGSLMQNVPNPFTGSTQIWYKVEKQLSVAILITDMNGKEIQKIDQGTKERGSYKVDFVNSNLAPGTYFYTLISDGMKIDTKKMIIRR